MHRILDAAETASAVDRPVAAVGRAVRGALRGGALDRLLRGSWLGHPVHPLLITVPVGTWTAAAVADFIDRGSARTLIGIGLAATPPTILTGLVELSTLDRKQGRVGGLHAAANLASTGCYLASYLCRRRSAHTAGVVWSTLGLLAVSVGGALGGHLSYAQGAGVRRESR